MKFLVSIIICFTVILFSCTDRDDDLEGVHIRVQNTTGITLKKVLIDSLVFVDIKADQSVFYQKFEGSTLPNSLVITGDSISTTVDVTNTIEIDTTALNLFTYQIKGLTAGANAEAKILKD